MGPLILGTDKGLQCGITNRGSAESARILNLAGVAGVS